MANDVADHLDDNNHDNDGDHNNDVNNDHNHNMENGTFFRNVPKGISSYLILMEGIIFWDVDSAFANSKIIPGWNPQLLPVTKNLHGNNKRKILVKKMIMFVELGSWIVWWTIH